MDNEITLAKKLTDDGRNLTVQYNEILAGYFIHDYFENRTIPRVITDSLRYHGYPTGPGPIQNGYPSSKNFPDVR